MIKEARKRDKEGWKEAKKVRNESKERKYGKKERSR